MNDCQEIKSYEPNNNAFCARVPLDALMDPCHPTMNKALTGTANKRTLVQPTISPPSHDITVWRQNPSIEHSQINKKTPLNPTWAGFDVPVNSTGKNAGSCSGAAGASWADIEVHSPYLNPLQPSIYTSTDQFQPINSNLGIAMTPQFPNTTYEREFADNEIFFDTNSYKVKARGDDFFPIRCNRENTNSSGGTDYIYEPPCQAPLIRSQPDPEFTAPEGVYDPRFTGYGANDRAYVDALLGAPHFYYDDINAVRMPNYITRSKIDSCVTPVGDTYGRLNAGHLALNDIKPYVEQSWTNNSLDYRVNLSKSLMRKRNEEMVQNRLAPKYTIYPA